MTRAHRLVRFGALAAAAAIVLTNGYYLRFLEPGVSRAWVPRERARPVRDGHRAFGMASAERARRLARGRPRVAEPHPADRHPRPRLRPAPVGHLGQPAPELHLGRIRVRARRAAHAQERRPQPALVVPSEPAALPGRGHLRRRLHPRRAARALGPRQRPHHRGHAVLGALRRGDVRDPHRPRGLPAGPRGCSAAAWASWPPRCWPSSPPPSSTRSTTSRIR